MAVSRCRFVGVAAQWTAALLDQVDQERQGVDLFGRDALVLGHVLSCLVCPCHLLPCPYIATALFGCHAHIQKRRHVMWNSRPDNFAA